MAFEYEILIDDEVVYSSEDREDALYALEEESHFHKDKLSHMTFKIIKNDEEVLSITGIEDILDYLDEM